MDIESLRKYKIFGIAMFDLVVSLIFMIIIFLIAHKIHYQSLPVLPFIIAAILLTIPTGILFHVLFGINTTLNHRLGLSGPHKNIK